MNADGNGAQGVIIDGKNSVVGGFETGAGNIILANGGHGVWLFCSSGTGGTAVLNNYIGLRTIGTATIGNGGDGVAVRSPGNRVGATGGGNYISGNTLSGISITEPAGSADGNVLQSNRIGLALDGTTNLGNGSHGISIGANVTNTVVLDSYISGNGGDGIFTDGDNTLVRNNYIGTNSAGTGPVGNDGSGIRLESNNNTVESLGSFATANLIGGHTASATQAVGNGVAIADGSTGNIVRGNLIGVNAAGDAIPNQRGVYIHENSDDNTVGGTSVAHRNVISGNLDDGVAIPNGQGNVIEGNWIGLNPDGDGSVPNLGTAGVVLVGTGPGTAIRGNVISGNDAFGVYLGSADGTEISGNRIGTTPNGLGIMANGQPGTHAGIYVYRSTNTTIGGTDGITPGGACTGDCNLISGNNTFGIRIVQDGQSVDGTRIQNNYIGTDINGTAEIPNATDGIAMAAIGDIVIEGNLIGGNGDDGISNTAAGATQLIIRGNRIGLDVNGVGALPNHMGIHLNGPSGVTIGQPGAGNFIAGNTQRGILIENGSTAVIQANTIGQLSGQGNVTGGILIDGDGAGTLIGGTVAGEGNAIQQNGGPGVAITGPTTSAVILGNTIRRNSGLGIDLGVTGPTLNDDESDGIQNFPVVTSIDVDGAAGTSEVFGTLTSTPNTNYRIEVFDAVAENSLYGEGDQFRGFVNVLTDGSGFVSWNVTVPFVYTGITRATTTATELDGLLTPLRTSEFSAGILAQRPPITFIVDTNADTDDAVAADGLCEDASDNCSLRAAIQEANSIWSADEIQLPSGTYNVLALMSTSPPNALAISDDVSIQGTGADTTFIVGGPAATGYVIGNSAGSLRFTQGLGPIGLLEISGVTITGTDGGGILSGAPMSVVDSAVRDSAGIGISTAGAQATLDVIRSTISGNASSAEGGGIRTQGAHALIEQSTISGNSAVTQGGGVYLNGSATILASTITANTAGTGAGGVHAFGAASHAIDSSIIAGNTGLAGSEDLSGTFTSNLHHNLLGFGGTFTPDGTDITGVADPELGALANNGGPTETHLPDPTSPAIDNGANTGLAIDQRGIARPIGPAYDIGSVEAPLTGAQTFVVTNTADSGPGSLRQAILDANANAATLDTINFNIPGAGPHSISVPVALPIITDAVLIDGLSQPGAVCGPLGAPTRQLLIEVRDSTLFGVSHGFLFAGPDASGSTIRGLAINHFVGSTAAAIRIESGADNGTIYCNNIGADADGDTADIVLQRNVVGIHLENTTGATIRENLVVNNAGTAIHVLGGGSHDVLGNFIGVLADGATLASSNGRGIYIGNSSIANPSTGNNIGDGTAAGRNVIAGHNFDSVRAGVVVEGGTNTIRGNYIGTDNTGTQARANYRGIWVTSGTGNVIGGTQPGDGNLISGNTTHGVEVLNAGGTIVQGNLIGVAPDGLTIVANGDAGIALLGNTGNSQIGDLANVSPTCFGGCNVISGNSGPGVLLAAGNGPDNVSGNFIGTDITGVFAVPNAVGIRVTTQPLWHEIFGNLISGNTSHGIETVAPAGIFAGLNFIGVQSDGSSPRPNGGDGILLNGDAVSQIGSAENIIAYNTGAGIRVTGTSDRAQISENRIFENGALGIDIGAPGTQTNDPLDADSGANNGQNHPVILGSPEPGGQVSGAINSVPSSSITIELFSSPTCDPSGFGEGMIFLGATTVVTDGSGFAPWVITPSMSLVALHGVTATSTTGTPPATSEFSACVLVQAVGPQTFVVTNTADSGLGSLRQAILDANAHPGPDNIHFNIPGAGPHTIAPATNLPAVTGLVTINGATQPGSTANSLAAGTNATIRVILDGSGLLTTGLDFGPGSDGSTMQGLSIGGFTSAGITLRETSTVVVAGNFIGVLPDGVTPLPNGAYGIVILGTSGTFIGTGALEDRNLISGNGQPGCPGGCGGIRIEDDLGTPSTGNRIRGNLIGTTATGNASLANAGDGITVRSFGNIVGGPLAGDANTIGGNTGAGIRVEGLAAGATTIERNRIGVGSNGIAAVSNAIGISLFSGSGGNIIGSATARNRIENNTSIGIEIVTAPNNTIAGNTIIANGSGISIASSGNTVGGTAALQSNSIRDNLGDGILLSGAAATGNAIYRNSIDANAGLGISHAAATVATPDIVPHTAGTADIAVSWAGPTLVEVSIEVFASPTCDPSGSGEGRTFLGSASGTTDETTGVANVFVVPSRATVTGEVLTATATSMSSGETSVFSFCVLVTPPAGIAVSAEVSTSTPEVEAGAFLVDLSSIPPTAALALSQTIAGTPITAIGNIESSPITAIPITAIPITAITTITGTPITAIPITAIPITAIGGWTALLDDTSLAGRPLHAISLGEALAAIEQSKPQTYAELTLEDINLLGTSAFSHLSIASFLLGDVPCSDLYGSCNGTNYMQSEIGAGDIFPGTLASVPITAIVVESTPITAIPITAIPITAIPITAIPITAIPITAIPITAIDPTIANVDIVDIEGPPGYADMCDYLLANGILCSSLPQKLGALIQSQVFRSNASTFASIPITAIPITAIEVGSTPITAIDLGSTPITAIGYQNGIETAPITAIPITAIDLQAIELGTTPITAIPITAIPITAIGAESTPITAIPITAISMGDLIASTPITAIPITAIPITAIDMAATPITAIPITAIPITAIGNVSFTAICGPGGFVESVTGGGTFGSCEYLKIDPNHSSLLQLYLALKNAGYPDALASLTLAEVLQGGISAGAISPEMLQRTSLSVINIESLPITAIPITAIPITAILLEGTPITAIEINDTPITAIPITAIPITAIPITAITALIDCDHPGIDCSVDSIDDAWRVGAWEPNTTLEQVVTALGYSAADVDYTMAMLYGQHSTGRDLTLAEVELGQLTLGDIHEANADAFTGTTLGALLGATSQSFIGTNAIDRVRFFLSFILGDRTIGELHDDGGHLGDLTVGQLLLTLLERADYPWEDLDFEELGIQRETGDTPAVNYRVSFRVDSLTSGFVTTVEVALPYGFLVASAAPVITPAGPQAGAPIIDRDARRQTVRWDITGVNPNTDYTFDFKAFSSLRLGEGTISVTVQAGTSSDSVIGAPVMVKSREGQQVDGLCDPEVDQDCIAPATVGSSVVLLGHIDSTTDADIFQVVGGPKGTRIAVYINSPGTDTDIIMYRADLPSLLSTNIDARDITLQSIPVGDSGSGSYADGLVLEPETLQDIPLETLPIVAASVNRSDAPETIEVTTTEDDEAFYIKVTGYNQQFSQDPYALRVKVVSPIATPICSPPVHPFEGQVAAAVTPGTASTLILVNQQRMQQQFGPDVVGTLPSPAPGTMMHALQQLAAVSGVGGQLVPVDHAYNAAASTLDANPCDPDGANAIVASINDVIAAWRAASATPIQNIVIVGDDDAIPFARIRDLTRLSNEREYAETLSDVRGGTFGALATGHILSDDPYADVDPIRWLDRYLYVPDIPLGRLVETPEEIMVQVQQYIDNNGFLDSSTAFTAGYDFLSDGTLAVSQYLDDDYSVTSITPTPGWSATDLRTQFFGAADPQHIASLNAHFDHYRLLPDQPNTVSALFTSTDSSLEGTSLRFSRRLLFSMGCHSGLSVGDALFGTSLDPRTRDWAQALAQQGAAIWIANTGFGYGDTGTVALSERLMSVFAGRLDGSLTAGQALMAAKQHYFATLGLYGVYDEKVMAEATFYGLPMWKVLGPFDAAVPLATPNEIAHPVPSSIGGGITSTSVSIDLGFIEPTSSVNQFWQVDADETRYDGATGLVSPEDGGTQATHYRPIVPRFSFDVTQDGLKAHGALITSITQMDDVEDVDPLFHRPITDSSQNEPELTFSNASFPGTFQNITSYTAVDKFVAGDEDPIRQNLVLIPGQVFFDGTEAVQRLFSDMEVEVYYAPNGITDFVQPTITYVDAQVIATGAETELTVVVDASDLTETGGEGSVERVYVLFRPAGNTAATWTPIDLEEVDGRWVGAEAVPAGTTEVQYYIQAVDAAGNVGASSNKATYFRADAEVPPALPANIAITLSGAPVILGYYAGPVTVAITSDPLDLGITFTCSLDGSAFGPCPSTVSGNGIHRLVVQASDGGVGAVDIPIKVVGLLPPSVVITTPEDGRTYATGQVKLAAYTCAPGMAGVSIVSCTSTVPVGAPIDTAAPGTKTFTVVATDSASQVTTLNVTYFVKNACDMTPTITGTTGNNTLNGTPGDDVIHGLGGNDKINGNGGDDVICAGNGNDVISTGDGNTVIVAGNGNNVITTGDGHHVIHAGTGNDKITTGSGNDVIHAGNGNNHVDAGSGNNTIAAGSGNDFISSGGGDDTIDAGGGNNEVEAGDGDNTILAGGGNDRITSGAGNDTIDAGAGNNRVDAGGGDDHITAGGGNDRIDGEAGHDTCSPGGGNNQLTSCEVVV